MRIKRLKLTGFKSFVEPTELHIEAGLTGVVGPNGCGKSNLLEALRWVMGENSPKSMRGGGMEDVIFAGTAQRPSRDFAEVTLLAEHEQQHENIPGVIANDDDQRTGSRPPDRARRGQRLSRQWPRRARQGHCADLCRRRHRRAQPGAGQPGPNRLDHFRQAAGTADDA
jgi:predicted ATPase